MGLGGISVWQLLIILVIVVLIFGTKKLKNMGGDIGGAVKNFKSAMTDEEKAKAEAESEDAVETDSEAVAEAPEDETKDKNA